MKHLAWTRKRRDKILHEATMACTWKYTGWKRTIRCVCVRIRLWKGATERKWKKRTLIAPSASYPWIWGWRLFLLFCKIQKRQAIYSLNYSEYFSCTYLEFSLSVLQKKQIIISTVNLRHLNTHPLIANWMCLSSTLASSAKPIGDEY